MITAVSFSFHADTAALLIYDIDLGKEGDNMEQITTEDFQIIDNCLMIRLPEEIDHHGAGAICANADRLLMR